MSTTQDHLRGLALTTAGVLVLTPDALLLRLLEADPWTVVFWRGLLMALGLGAGVALAARSGQRLQAFRGIGRAGLLVGLLWGGEAVLFVLAINTTSVANTLIIVSAAPLVAALLSRVALREPVGALTWAAILAAMFGIVLVVRGGIGRGVALGDAAALATAALVAVILVVLRHARHVNMLPATAFGGLVAALLAAGAAAPFAVAPGDAAVLAVMGLVMLPVAFGLITLGPRYLPAPEVSLVFLLQTVLGPVLVWLALGEGATLDTVVGGGVVVATLAVHSWLRLRQLGRQAEAPRPAHPAGDRVGADAGLAGRGRRSMR